MTKLTSAQIQEGYHLFVAARARKERKKKIRQGICTLCQKPALPDLRTCAEHREYMKRANHKRYQKLKADHRCTSCGCKKKLASSVLCKSCLERVREVSAKANKQVYQDRLAAGVCTRCGKDRTDTDRRWCTACREKGRNYSQKTKN